MKSTRDQIEGPVPKVEKEDIFQEILVNTVEGARRLRYASKIVAGCLGVPLTTVANWVYNNRRPGPWRELAGVVSRLLDDEAEACRQIAARITAGVERYDAIAQLEMIAGSSAECRVELCKEAMRKLDWRTTSLDRDWAEMRSLHRQACQELECDRTKKNADSVDWDDPDKDGHCPA